MKKLSKILIATVVTPLILSGCSGADPLASSSSSSSAGTAAAVVVGSANFPESELLAELYAGALAAKGVAVTKKLNIASRETYVPALEGGEIDLVPEYTGAFAKYLNADADTSTQEAALVSLQAELPDTLEALEPSAAEDKDSITVTRATAEQYSLTTIEDLAPVAGELVLGGPPEWKERALGVSGLKEVYGLEFKSFKPLDVAGPLTVQALKNGQVQAANLFTTDPAIKANDFVTLEDTKSFFGAQNVIPVIRKEVASEAAVAALNSVSAKLTTDGLATLVTKVVVDKQDADEVAAEWLQENGIG